MREVRASRQVLAVASLQVGDESDSAPPSYTPATARRPRAEARTRSCAVPTPDEDGASPRSAPPAQEPSDAGHDNGFEL
jgi:hypothetical protein